MVSQSERRSRYGCRCFSIAFCICISHPQRVLQRRIVSLADHERQMLDTQAKSRFDQLRSAEVAQGRYVLCT